MHSSFLETFETPTNPAASRPLTIERSQDLRNADRVGASRAPLADTAALRVRIRDFQRRFARLDLSPIVARALTRPARASHATPSPTLAIALQCYRDFLCLLDLYPDRQLAPTPQIDAIWHAHILDTRRYRRDCCLLFGGFVDHEPYDELDDRAAGDRAGDRVAPFPQVRQTRQLFRHHFGYDPASATWAIGFGDSRLGGCTGGACARGVA